jgi:hypothetical protein
MLALMVSIIVLQVIILQVSSRLPRDTEGGLTVASSLVAELLHILVSIYQAASNYVLISIVTRLTDYEH